MEKRYDIVDAAEDAAKVGYSVGVFSCKFFYQVSGIEALKNSMDTYIVSRFSQRLEYFRHEHDSITEDEKREFYEDLKNNKQNLNYLYEVIEKARTATHELHAKILAVLSRELIRNKEFNFYESSLVANIHTLTYDDLITYKQVLRETHAESLDKNNEIHGSLLTHTTFDYRSYISIQKFLNIGMLSYPQEKAITPILNLEKTNSFRKSMDFVANDYSLILMAILQHCIDD